MRLVTGFVLAIAAVTLFGCDALQNKDAAKARGRALATESAIDAAEDQLEKSQQKAPPEEDSESKEGEEDGAQKPVSTGTRDASIVEARRRADRNVCLNNLKQLGMLAHVYADDHKNLFPIAGGTNPPSHRSLQVIVDSNTRLKPELFVCPSSRATPASADENGHFQLTERNTSYAWIGRRMKSTGPPHWPLAACLNHQDEGGVNVVYLSMLGEWASVSEFRGDRLVDVEGKPVQP